MKTIFNLMVAALLFASGAAREAAAGPLAPADPIRGKVVAEVRCGPCHHLRKNLKKVGPSLAGVYGRAPTITGVPFARWDRNALEAWLAGPSSIKPNTRMRIPALNERDRRDIIAYLAAASLQAAH